MNPSPDPVAAPLARYAAALLDQAPEPVALPVLRILVDRRLSLRRARRLTGALHAALWAPSLLVFGAALCAQLAGRAVSAAPAALVATFGLIAATTLARIGAGSR